MYPSRRRQALCLEERLISLETVPEAGHADFSDIAPGAWLLNQIPWSSAEHRIHAVSAAAEERPLSTFLATRHVLSWNAEPEQYRPGHPCPLHLSRRQACTRGTVHAGFSLASKHAFLPSRGLIARGLTMPAYWTGRCKLPRLSKNMALPSTPVRRSMPANEASKRVFRLHRRHRRYSRRSASSKGGHRGRRA